MSDRQISNSLKNHGDIHEWKCHDETLYYVQSNTYQYKNNGEKLDYNLCI
jgi:hypothetical protein